MKPELFLQILAGFFIRHCDSSSTELLFINGVFCAEISINFGLYRII
jgi:hypothetical protein